MSSYEQIIKPFDPQFVHKKEGFKKIFKDLDKISTENAEKSTLNTFVSKKEVLRENGRERD